MKNILRHSRTEIGRDSECGKMPLMAGSAGEVAETGGKE
jgi:hypothetical protein